MFRPLWRSSSTTCFWQACSSLRNGRAFNSHGSPSVHSATNQVARRSYVQQRYRRRGFNQARYQQTSNLFRRWAAQPTFYYQCLGIGVSFAGFYMYNVETVPVTGRRRFNIIPERFEASQGLQLYQDTVNQYRGHILPPSHPLHRKVEQVLDRLVPHSGLSSEHNQWEVQVIASNEANAFVIPGGKVFVFTGMLNMCENDDQLAAVLGHEIAHNVAHHAAERMSSYGVLLPVAFGAFLVLGLGDFANLSRTLVDLCFLRPGSRKQEAEADHIGLMMMSEACFDPRGALQLWTKMDKEQGAGEPPQFLSTHPSSYNRREAIGGWLESAERKREASGCGPTAGWAKDFNKAVDREWDN